MEEEAQAVEEKIEVSAGMTELEEKWAAEIAEGRKKKSEQKKSRRAYKHALQKRSRRMITHGQQGLHCTTGQLVANAKMIVDRSLAQ